MPAILIALVLAVLFFALLPPSAGTLPVYRDANGNVLPGSLSEKLRVEIDGNTYGLMLLSQNVENPVLLVCGGGPGIPQYLLESLYPSVLAEEFTVCYWDYAGTGLSAGADTAPEEMTTEKYVADALAVTAYLSGRFSRSRIYIMGHSFGTYVALKAVQAHPEKYLCYLAMSQICDQKESEYLAFDYMAEQYRSAGSAKMLRRFESCDIRASDEAYERYFHSGLRDKAMHELGVGTAREMRSVITGLFFPSLRCAAYTQSERIGIWAGKVRAARFPAADDAIRFNAFTDVPGVDIPVYFIVGEYDYTCCASLQKSYYEAIDAPQKDIFLFERSAHSPLYEEPDRARAVLREIKSREEQ